MADPWPAIHEEREVLAKDLSTLTGEQWAGAGFRFNEMTAREIARETAGTPADNLAEFRRYAQASTHPPRPACAG
jgi:hypothetical protein